MAEGAEAEEDASLGGRDVFPGRFDGVIYLIGLMTEVGGAALPV